MREFDENRIHRSIVLHAIIGALVGCLTMLFMYFIGWDLDNLARFSKFTASQNPIELPIYLLLCGMGASLVYWVLVGLFKLITRKRKT